MDRGAAEVVRSDVPRDARFTFDPTECPRVRWSASLGAGSAYVLLAPEEGHCRVWLGGETEDRTYDGSPTGFCRFPRSHPPIEVVAGDSDFPGGPAEIDSCFCVRL